VIAAGAELADFADRVASAEDRDWRALDPRGDDASDDEAGDEDEGE